MNDPWERHLERILIEEMFRFRAERQPVTVLSSLTDYRTPREILDELREHDPEAAMLLGEWIVCE